MYQVTVSTLEETTKLATTIATLLRPGDVLTLEGELGVGKTAFTKGLAEGLGITDTVTSPTFTIIKEYEGKLPLYHMDAYRLEHSEEDIGFEEYFSGSGVCVVEWARFIEDYLPKERLNITIEYLDEHSRIFFFHPQGDHYEAIIKDLVLTE